MTNRAIRLKYKFVKKPKNIPLLPGQLCKKNNCKNAHIWISKREGCSVYSFALSRYSVGVNGGWYAPAKQICVKETGPIMEIIDKLRAPDRIFERKILEAPGEAIWSQRGPRQLSIDVDENFMFFIFGDFAYKQNWQLFVF